MTLDRLPRGRFAVTDAVLDVLDLRARQGRFQLTGADLEVVRKGDEITLAGRVELPDHLGSFIDFEAEASGELADSAAVDWRARMDARDLDLEQWSAMLPDSFRVPTEGHGSIRVSARGRGRDVTSLRLQPELEDLRLAGSDQMNSRASPATSECSATPRRFRSRRRVSSCRGPAGPGGRRVSRRGCHAKEGRIAAVAARADYLRIENLAALAGALPPGRCVSASRRSRRAANSSGSTWR